MLMHRTDEKHLGIETLYCAQFRQRVDRSIFLTALGVALSRKLPVAFRRQNFFTDFRFFQPYELAILQVSHSQHCHRSMTLPALRKRKSRLNPFPEAIVKIWRQKWTGLSWRQKQSVSVNCTLQNMSKSFDTIFRSTSVSLALQSRVTVMLLTTKKPERNKVGLKSFDKLATPTTRIFA